MSRDRKISVRSVMGGILCVIFIPVIFINLTLIISTYTKPGEMPGVFGIKPVTVRLHGAGDTDRGYDIFT